MTSKLKIAEAVLNRLNGGKIDRDSKITLRQAMFAVSEARNFVIRAYIQENLKMFGYFDVPFEVISEYTVPIQYNESRKKWYVTMPVNILNLHNGLGIYNVFQEGQEESGFVPTSNGSVGLYSHSESSTTSGRPNYYPQDKTLWLSNVPYEVGCEPVNLVLRLIVDSDDLDQRADFKVTGDMEIRITDFAFNKLAPQVQLPQDPILNNLNP